MNLKPVAFFDPLPVELRRMACPFCGGLVVVFMTTIEEPLAVDVDGTPHVLSCSAFAELRGELNEILRLTGTAYDVALLRARVRFTKPFL